VAVTLMCIVETENDCFRYTDMTCLRYRCWYQSIIADTDTEPADTDYPTPVSVSPYKITNEQTLQSAVVVVQSSIIIRITTTPIITPQSISNWHKIFDCSDGRTASGESKPCRQFTFTSKLLNCLDG